MDEGAAGLAPALDVVPGVVAVVAAAASPANLAVTVAVAAAAPASSARLAGRQVAGRKNEVRRLARGVDAGVRAAGAVDGDALARDRRHGFLDDLLDRQRVVLPLPAGVVRAVVGDEQAVLHGVEGRRSISRRIAGGSQTAP